MNADPASAVPETGATTRHQVALATFWFGISFLWGSFLAVVLPFLLVPEHASASNPGLVSESAKNTALAVLEGVGLVVAIVVQPAAGALSDRVRSRFGRRRPLVVVGTAGGVVSLLVVGLAPSFLWLVGVYCVLQASVNTAQGAYQGLLPDTVPAAQRGRASGYMGVATLAGQVAGTLAGGFLPAHVVSIPIAAVVALTAAVTVLGVTESPSTGTSATAGREGRRPRAGALRAYLAEFRAYPDFCWVVVSRFMLYTGLACIQRFAANYLRDTFTSYSLLGVDLGKAQAATGVLFAVVIVVGLAVTYPAVKLSDRIGRRRVIVTSGLLGAVGTSLFFVAQSLTEVVGAALFVGAAFGMLVSVDWAYMADLAPRDRAGKFLGFSNVATAGAQAGAPFLLGPVIDAVDAHSAGGGYRVMFVVATLFFLAGALTLRRVRVHRLEEDGGPALAGRLPAASHA